MADSLQVVTSLIAHVVQATSVKLKDDTPACNPRFS